MIYLDSCALVKLVLDEKESQALKEHVQDRHPELVTSELALTEVIRVVRRSCYDPQRQLRVDRATLDDVLSQAHELVDDIDHVTVDTDTFLRAGMFADDPHLGSLDAIHLVCALEVGPVLKSFVTYDKTLARVATELGLPVDQPA